MEKMGLEKHRKCYQALTWQTHEWWCHRLKLTILEEEERKGTGVLQVTHLWGTQVETATRHEGIQPGVSGQRTSSAEARELAPLVNKRIHNQELSVFKK